MSPICPWCGEEVDDRLCEQPFNEDGTAVVDCLECGRQVLVTRTVDVIYTAVKIEDDQP